MPRDVEREQVLLVGVAAVGDLYIIHKLEEGMLGRRSRRIRAVAVEVLEEQVDVVGRTVEEVAKWMRREHHAPGGVNSLAKARCGVHTVNISVQPEDQDMPHVGVDFERPDDCKTGVLEYACQFLLFPAAGVFGEANAVKSYALGFLYQLRWA